MGVVFQYPMGMDTDMGTIFENGYEYRHGSTCPALPIAIPNDQVFNNKKCKYEKRECFYHRVVFLSYFTYKNKIFKNKLRLTRF